MWYAILSEDIEDSRENRAAGRPAHIARLKKLVEQGRLLVAGPHPGIDSEDPGDAGFSGSLVIAEFDSLEDAIAWADADPYFESGAYEKVTVKPFKRVLP